MLKRSATTDLNHTNWDDEEEQEKPSDFKLASAEVMSKRAIKTGKRRLGGTPAPAAAASPFAKFSFGAATTSTSSSAAAPAAPPSFTFSSTQPSSANGVPPVDSKKVGDKDEPDEKKKTYLAKLKGLNEELLSWVETHFKKNPTCIFTPVFNDYDKYLKIIQAERDSTSESKTTSSFRPMSGFPKLSSQPVNLPISTAGSATNPTPVSTSASPTLSSEKSETKSAAPLSSIFSNSANKPDEPIKSIFGNVESKSTASPFSFGGTKPFTFGNVSSPLLSGSTSSVPPSTEVQNDEDSEEPPKNEFKPVTEDDAVFSQRVKVFVKKDTDYADRGVGTLFIKPANNKFQAVVRADTSLGNLLLNIILVESMPVKRMGANNVMLVCVPLPGTDSKPLPTLLKVKTKEDADKLFDEINKYKK